MGTEKTKYKKMFNIVREELNRVDPIGIIENNKNLEDEYDLENQEILTLIKKHTDPKEFAEKICEIFVKSTEIELSPDEFFECAKNILDKIKDL